MALPRAVQAIGDHAEEMAKKAGLTGEKTQQPAANEQPAPASEPDTIPAPDYSKEHVDQNDWKERMARYRASSEKTIGELRQENSNLSSQISSLQATVTSLQAQMSQLNAAPVTPKQSPAEQEQAEFEAWLDTMGDDFKENYTEDFQKHMYKATKMGQAARKPDDSDIRHELETVKQRQARTDQERFYADLDKAFPNGWEKSKDDPEWAKFCDETPPFSQHKFGKLVGDAVQSYNSATLIRILNEYNARQNAGKPEPKPNPMDAMLTPEGGGDGGNTGGDIGEAVDSFTESQIHTFYKDVAIGKKYTPEQAARIDKQIEKAVKAGKILPG